MNMTEANEMDRIDHCELVDARVMGQLLKISRKTVLQMATEGRIPVIRIGVKTIRFEVDAVIEALKNMN